MFTSRLPKSTSVRRPSNPNDGISNSNIPVSVRKANLFTPQPERSYKTSFGNASTARKSSYQSTSKSAPDQEEQARILRSLAETMKLHAPNATLPDWIYGKKFPSSVSSGDAKEILQFLIGLNVMNTEFKINKLDVDVPEVLNELEYPHVKSMTRSTLVSITNSLAVRNFLTLCDWLVRQINVLYAPRDINNYSELIQILLLKVVDQDFDLREEFQRRHPQTTSDSYLVESKEIDNEIEQLQKKLESLDEKAATIQNLEQHEVEMQQYNQTMINLISEKKAEMGSLKKQIEEKTKEHNELAETFELLKIKAAAINLGEESELKAKLATLKAENREHQHQLDIENSENDKLEEQLRRAKHELVEFKNRQQALLKSVSDEHDKMLVKLKKSEAADAEHEKSTLDRIRALKDVKLKQASAILRREELDHEKCVKIGQVMKEEKAKMKAISKKIRRPT